MTIDSEDETPWEQTDAEYDPPATKQRIKRIIRGTGELGGCGASMYCHHHDCENEDHCKPTAARTVLSIMERSPHPVSQTTRDRLNENGMDMVELPLHHVHDGFTAYVLIGPSETGSGWELTGWYCSADCIDAVCWPTTDHVAIAVELHVSHPPDIQRMGVPPRIKQIRGVYRQNPRVVQSKLSE